MMYGWLCEAGCVRALEGRDRMTSHLARVLGNGGQLRALHQARVLRGLDQRDLH